MNLSPKVRGALYVLLALANPVILYLGQQGKLDAFYVGLWAIVASAVAGLARLNTK